MAFDGPRYDHYIERAEEVRDIADTCRDPNMKQQFLNIAQQYEDLAKSMQLGRMRQ